jgi:ABC-type Zn2+ transport system substrate-binding protein/surface adhesin
VESDIASLKAKSRPIQQQISKLETERMSIQQELDEARKKPRVSDHALIRYFERKFGVSFEDTRAEILTPDRIAAIRAGAKSIKHDGMVFKITGTTIVTVLD